MNTTKQLPRTRKSRTHKLNILSHCRNSYTQPIGNIAKMTRTVINNSIGLAPLTDRDRRTYILSGNMSCKRTLTKMKRRSCSKLKLLDKKLKCRRIQAVRWRVSRLMSRHRRTTLGLLQRPSNILLAISCGIHKLEGTSNKIQIRT